MVVMAPADENECRQMLYTAVTLDGPAAVRYPRGRGPGVAVEKTMTRAAGRARGDAPARPQRARAARLRYDGGAVHAIAERLDATLVNMRFVKPLDEALVAEVAATHTRIVTVEENVVAGAARAAAVARRTCSASAARVSRSCEDRRSRRLRRSTDRPRTSLAARGDSTPRGRAGSQRIERFWRGRRHRTDALPTG